MYFLDEEGKNKIPQRYFLPFCTRKLPPHSVENIFVSNFSHLSTHRQVIWEMENQSFSDNGTNRSSLFWGRTLAASVRGLQIVPNVRDLWSMPSFRPCETKWNLPQKWLPGEFRSNPKWELESLGYCRTNNPAGRINNLLSA